MKQILLLTFILTINITSMKCYSQDETTSETNQETIITGTHFQIIKPSNDFIISTKFIGLENEKLQSSIQIIESQTPFDLLVQIFETDVQTDEFDLIFKKEYNINNRKARLIKTKYLYLPEIIKITEPEKKGTPIIQYILINGDDNSSITITASYPVEYDKELAQAIEKSILSIRILEDYNFNPLANMSFEIDLSNSPLKFASEIGLTGAIFNTSGKLLSDTKDSLGLLIMTLPLQIANGEQRNTSIKNAKRGTDNLNIQEINSICLGNTCGYEIIGKDSTDNENINLKYTITIFDQEKYIIIQGTSTYSDYHVKLFKTICKTFKQKNCG